MTGTNHGLTGALIGATVADPVVAVPVAFLSHFVLDALPHFGWKDHTSKFFLAVLALDVTLGLGLLYFLLTSGFTNVGLVVVCAVVAFIPDLLWAPMWVSEMKGRAYRLKGLSYWFKKIQWGEFHWGLAIEIPFGITILAFLLNVVP